MTVTATGFWRRKKKIITISFWYNSLKEKKTDEKRSLNLAKSNLAFVSRGVEAELFFAGDLQTFGLIK